MVDDHRWLDNCANEFICIPLKKYMHVHVSFDGITQGEPNQHFGASTKWPCFADDICKDSFFSESDGILIQISLKYVPMC